MMAVLGLGSGFAQELVRLERSSPQVSGGDAPRLRFIQQQNALAALGAFSKHVHVWYPLFRPGFSDRYIRVMSGPLAPGPESCLVLSVAAVGALVQQDHALGTSRSENSSDLYLEAAVASLPAVIIDYSIESVQSLIVLSLYHCCISRPCQAYDYAMIASFKVQNLLRCADNSTGELYEQIKRCYWAVLLLESELRDQLDMVDSGIWDHDDKMALPDSRRTWHFEFDGGSPASATTASPGSNLSTDSVIADKGPAYFLAEIAMRRMLHRCYTAIRRTPQGEIAYAPGVALELELQLDEWHGYLPDMFHFRHLTPDIFSLPQSLTSMDPPHQFLRVQYYCCKISIYWPAVYQCIQDGTATAEVIRHCERFFHAYIQAIPSMLLSIRDCIVNRWTLYATIFTTSMAAIKAAETPCLRDRCAVDWLRLMACLESTRSVDIRIVQASASLSLLHSTLAERLTGACSSLGGT
ncbi:hypothetical protein BR93DRAFT_927709 [Coniochaeta sp. PMI_546]|nr:hypothetical protein BR93DRAFT_927709 [Coniochaeta sp. PMI_546]